MNLEQLKLDALSILSHKITVPEKEGEKTVLNFFLDSFTEEIGKKGAKVVVPVAISKIAVNKAVERILIKEDMEDADTLEKKNEAIARVSGSHLVNYLDKSISGYASYLASRPEFSTPEERQTASRFLLSAMLSVVAENEKQVSQADPLLEAKRIFAKSAPVAELNYNDPAAVFVAWEKAELERISRIMEKASSLTPTDLRAFIDDKTLNNGTDENGYVKLRGKKDESKTDKGE